MHSDLNSDQHVDLYPSYVFYDASIKQWTLPFSGFVYREGHDGVRRKVFMRLLQQVLDVNVEQLKSNERFSHRIPGFLHEPQRGASVVVSALNGQVTATGSSGRSGHVRASISVPSHLTPTGWGSEPSKFHYSIAMPPSDERKFSLTADVIPPQGTSVISDIDDTLKISQVAHRRQLLHNTFLHEFVAVPGMAQLFQNWKNQGAAIHYVSSSPWQLFHPLNSFMAEHQFPNGSFHLRSYRFGDPTILRLFMSRKRNKFKIIESIFLQFPERQFILVGDSGEKDAEIYGKVARRFPRQTKQILIRRVDGRPWTNERVEKAFRRVPEDCWQTFQVPTQIRDIGLE